VRGMDIPADDIAASFQEAVADVITKKAVLAATEHNIDHILLGGGVAANSRLRELLTVRTAAAGIGLTIPPINLCTDNGAMVAALGAQLVAADVDVSGLDFSANPTQPVSLVSVLLRPALWVAYQFRIEAAVSLAESKTRALSLSRSTLAPKCEPIFSRCWTARVPSLSISLTHDNSREHPSSSAIGSNRFSTRSRSCLTGNSVPAESTMTVASRPYRAARHLFS